MKIQREMIESLQPWDMKTILRYSGLSEFLRAEECHRKRTDMPFLPSVHQVVDVVYWGNQEHFTYHQNLISTSR